MAVHAAWMGSSEAATGTGLAALSACVAAVLAGTEPKLMLLPHPKWGAPACSKKGTFGSSGNSASLLICRTEEFRDLCNLSPEILCLRSVSWGMQKVAGV